MTQQIMTHIRDNQIYREQFFELAKTTFGIDFTSWYNKGFWTDVYQPFVYVEQGQVVANASVSHLEFVINGKKLSALQIGTVMTALEHRNKGYGKALMSHVLKKYSHYDLIYLFANKNATGFYEKLEFKTTQLKDYSWTRSFNPMQCSKRLLSMDNPNDRQMLIEYSKEQYTNPVFDVKHTEGLVGFYADLVFSESVYFIAELEAIVIASMEGSTLILHDIISKNRPDLEAIVEGVITNPIDQVVFGFTPFISDRDITSSIVGDEDSTFYYKGDVLGLEDIKYPTTATA